MRWPDWRAFLGGKPAEERSIGDNSIFVSYRRGVDESWALLVRKELEAAFGAAAVFMDVRSIRTGDQWRDTITEAIRGSRVLVVVIGPGWRPHELDDDDDILRHELVTAIEAGVRLAPVTVGGASLPAAEAVPGRVAPLLDAQAHAIALQNCDAALDELGRAVDEMLRARSAQEIRAERDRLQSRVELLDRELAAITGSASLPASGREVDAYLSYSARADAEFARALQAGLHDIGRPRLRRRGTIRAFVDTVSLSAGPDLASAIEATLDAAEFLVLLASPEAAESAWVDHELRYWLQAKGPSSVLLVLTSGELVWDDALGDFGSASTSLPAALFGAFEWEPLWLDARDRPPVVACTLDNDWFLGVVAGLAAPILDMSGADVMAAYR